MNPMSIHEPSHVIACCGSIRSSAENAEVILDLCRESTDLDDYIGRVGKALQNGRRLCNSEILAGAGLCGARSLGSKIDYFPLIVLFPRRDRNVFAIQDNMDVGALSLLDTLQVNRERLDELFGKIADCDGLILSTPVYFGDRSSVANKLLQLTGLRSLLKGKVMGLASVGAKRNGGQETANVFCMSEALTQHALGVGNGPPTSQYGGTAVAGNAGDIVGDLWGLQSAYGTGQRTAHVGEIMRRGASLPPPERVTITILVTMETPQRLLAGYLENLSGRVRARLPWVDFQFIHLVGSTIYRCLGCATCPGPATGSTESQSRGRCIIRDGEDIMERTREALRKSDGLLVAGLNILALDQIIYRYQVFLERTRYIRHNDFELTNLVVAGFCYNQVGARVNPLHSLKVNTSFLRHNTIIHRPVEVIDHQGEILQSGEEELEAFCWSVRSITAGKKQANALPTPYMTHSVGGY
jgi:multimeric flavodoxin WrbA